MYEHKSETPLSTGHFFMRLFYHGLVAVSMLLASLGLGMWGYMHYEGLSINDAFVNAAMLLGGMGPINSLQTEGGKIFAGLYALYAGLIFIVMAALLFTPVLHRVMHYLHWVSDE